MKLLWLDIETTGLDPQRDKILEVFAGQATLDDPFTFQKIVHQVFHLGWDDQLLMDEYTMNMHSASGLVQDARNNPFDARAIEESLLGMVDIDAPRENKSTLAGRSVHFDLGFIRVHWPRLARHLSHRVYDVSAVEIYCRSLGMPRLEKANVHRAKADVEESVRHARMCADWIRHTPHRP